MEEIAAEVVAGELMSEGFAANIAAETASLVSSEAVGLAMETAAGSMASGISEGLALDTATSAAESAAGEVASTATEGGATPNQIQNVGTEPAMSETQKIAQQTIDADSLTPPTGSDAPADVTTRATDNFARAAAEAPKKGIVDSALEWIKANPTAAAIAGTQIAGAVGGAGKAALEKEIAQRNIRARRELLSQQYAEQLQQSRTGTLKNSAGVTPSGQKILLRPDGTPVYAGIVGSQIPV